MKRLLSLPQIAEQAGVTRQRMHQLWEQESIPFKRVDTGKQPRFADTPALREWALGIKECKELRKKRSKGRVRHINAGTVLQKTCEEIDSPNYTPDKQDLERAHQLLRAYFASIKDLVDTRIGPETANILSLIALTAKPRSSKDGSFHASHSTNQNADQRIKLLLAIEQLLKIQSEKLLELNNSNAANKIKN